jgi:hypothetical protein
MFRLIEGQIAGFYVPDDGTMYLADDLGEAEAEETLAHELVHALQDQSYELGKMIKVAEGDGDRVTAAHALAEGDAMSAMLEVSVGSAFAVSEDALRRILAISTSMSAVGATTPRVLTSSLTAPYADGFAFVQGLRRHGGWRAVDAAYGSLPVTTEQLLHLEKYNLREPAVMVAEPPVGALGEGYRAVWNEVMGEQGLRIVLEDWAHRTTAKEGAAGGARRGGGGGAGGVCGGVACGARYGGGRDRAFGDFAVEAWERVPGAAGSGRLCVEGAGARRGDRGGAL